MAEGLRLAEPPPQRPAAFHTAALLPTDTSVRYATLLSLAIATTSVIYLRFWLDRFDMASRYQRCASELVGLSLWRPESGAAQLWNFQFTQAKACLRPYAVSALTLALLGIAALLALAWTHYVLHPRWRIARRKLVALGPDGPPQLMSFLDGLVTAAGLRRPPRFWISLHRSNAQAVAFGTRRNHHIQLSGSLIGLFYDERHRDRFAAVVLHELAHARNGDIGYTYATIAVWRAFLIVGVLPFLALRLLPAVIGRPGGWAVAPMALKAFQPQAALSMAVLAALVFLTYYSILRTREIQADITAAAIGGPGALDQHLRHGRGGGWTLLSRHPQPQSRRGVLAGPLRQRWGQLWMVFFAGIAIASLQHNLSSLLMPAYLVLSTGRAGDAADAPVVALVSSVHLLGAALIVALACTLTWRAHLLDPHARLKVRRLIGWAGAATLGLLLGEPLALFHAGGGSWGFLTLASDRVVPAAVIAAGTLMVLLALVFGWAYEASVVWLPVIRSGMRRVFLAATLTGALGFAVPYVAWMGFRGTPFSLALYDWRPALGPWELSWHPPLERLVFSEYFPVFVMSLLPGSRLLLVVPLVFVLAGALRRSPGHRPKWLLETDLLLPRRGRLRLRRTALAGLCGAGACLLAGTALASLVWDSGGRRAGDDMSGAGIYLLFACTALSVAIAAVVAAYVAWAEPVAAGSLALLAAVVTTMTTAVLSVFPTAVAMCGPEGVAWCAGHYWRPLGAMALAVPNMLAVPRALVAACLAVTIVMTVRHLVHVSRRSTMTGTDTVPEPDQPAQPLGRRRVLLIGVPVVALASLAVFGACQFLSRSVPVEQINLAISPARVGQAQTTEVWLIRADGSDSRKLTDNDTYDGEPDLYRDRRVAFVSYRDGNYEIYVMNADGSAVTRLTDDKATDSTPRWSPDGRRIAFTSERDGNREIYVMKADGSDLKRLTDSPGFDGEPSWSPDGKRLAFVSERDRNKEIYVMDDDGSDLRRITNNTRADHSPSWSPADENVLAFSSDRAGAVSIYVMNPEGEEVKRLTTVGDGAPLWSPDGDHILFWTGRGLSGGAQEVWVMTKTGADQRRLTDFNGSTCWPSCEP